MNKFWAPALRGLQPYSPGEQPRVQGLIKLNTNEHPLAPSARVMAEVQNVTGDALRRYPDPDGQNLREAIAAAEGLSPEHVFLGNGSDEVLAHIFFGLLSSEPNLLVPDITYSFYPVWAQLYGLNLTELPLDGNLAVDIALFAETPGSILLANPNAPTGKALKLDQLRELIRGNPDRLVVIDEAYYGFGAESAAALLATSDNLVVTRSFSKSHALAGMRLGYALASPDLIEGLRRVKDSFNSYPVDALAQAAGLAAVEDREWFRTASELVMRNRDALASGLEALGFDVLPSAGNFVFARHAKLGGKLLFEHLRQHNILVRRWDKSRIADYLRITVGSESDCAALLECLAQKILTASDSGGA